MLIKGREYSFSAIHICNWLKFGREFQSQNLSLASHSTIWSHTPRALGNRSKSALIQISNAYIRFPSKLVDHFAAWDVSSESHFVAIITHIIVIALIFVRLYPFCSAFALCPFDVRCSLYEWNVCAAQHETEFDRKIHNVKLPRLIFLRSTGFFFLDFCCSLGLSFSEVERDIKIHWLPVGDTENASVYSALRALRNCDVSLKLGIRNSRKTFFSLRSLPFSYPHKRTDAALTSLMQTGTEKVGTLSIIVQWIRCNHSLFVFISYCKPKIEEEMKMSSEFFIRDLRCSNLKCKKLKWQWKP